MKLKVKQTYKVGDKVFASKNSEWGLEPMRITRNDEFSVLCKHPNFIGTGYFRKDEVEPFSDVRQKKLKKIISLKEKVRLEKEKLFGE